MPPAIKDKLYVLALCVCVLPFAFQTAVVVKFSKTKIQSVFFKQRVNRCSGSTTETGVKGQYRLSTAVKYNFTALFNKLLSMIKYLTASKYSSNTVECLSKQFLCINSL